MGRSRFFIRIFKRYMAFLACSSTCFLAFRKEPDLENTVPRYLYGAQKGANVPT